MQITFSSLLGHLTVAFSWTERAPEWNTSLLQATTGQSEADATGDGMSGVRGPGPVAAALFVAGLDAEDSSLEGGEASFFST
jgi:hypothetical protein